MESCGLEDVVMLGENPCCHDASSHLFLFGRHGRSVWMFVRLSTWREDVVLNSFAPRDWRENFCVSKPTFDYICFNLKPLVEKQNTSMRRSVSVERRVAITLWILATPSEYRSIAHLFGIAQCTVCVIVHETYRAIIKKLKSVYIIFLLVKI